MSNSKKAWESQAKWQKDGKDGNDSYQSKGSDYDKSVEKSQAFNNQAHSSKGFGGSGSIQHSGDKIAGWDQPGSHKNQHKWGEGGEAETKVSLGENAGYLGHFNSSKVLDDGHNTGEEVEYGASPTPSPTPNKKKQFEDAYNDNEKKSIVDKFKKNVLGMDD